MKKTLIISSPEVQERATRIVKNLILEPIHEIIIREYKETLSDRQRRFYWLWTGIIANDLGNTKEDQHILNKERLLVPILLADKEEVEFQKGWSMLRKVWTDGMKTEAEELKRQVVDLLSITRRRTPQMTLFLKAMEQDAISLGINLPYPEDER